MYNIYKQRNKITNTKNIQLLTNRTQCDLEEIVNLSPLRFQGSHIKPQTKVNPRGFQPRDPRNIRKSKVNKGDSVGDSLPKDLKSTV